MKGELGWKGGQRWLETHHPGDLILSLLGLQNYRIFPKCTGFPEIPVGKFLESGGNKQEIQNRLTVTSEKPRGFGKVTDILQLHSLLKLFFILDKNSSFSFSSFIEYG